MSPTRRPDPSAAAVTAGRGEPAAALSRGRAADVRRAGRGGGDVPGDTSGRRGGEGEAVPGRGGSGEGGGGVKTRF